MSELWPPTGLFIPQVIYEYGEPGWNDTDRAKPVPKPLCPQVPRGMAVLRGEKLATNHLSHMNALLIPLYSSAA
jgi:hypothetical protein